MPSSRDASPATVSQPSKKLKKISDLSMEEEDSMAEWIRDNECLYNKKVVQGQTEKDKLWDEKARELHRDREILQVW